MEPQISNTALHALAEKYREISLLRKVTLLTHNSLMTPCGDIDLGNTGSANGLLPDGITITWTGE